MIHRPPSLVFYSDDLTGATDVTEALAVRGIRSVTFFEPPGAESLRKRFPDIEAVGVAGRARSMSPSEMETALPPVFEALVALGAELFHYKVCSTFDSAPHIGSIGKAIDIAFPIFGNSYVPVVVGVPALGRYVSFGQLFADIDGRPLRIDRHPMSRHPVTPMKEADLLIHLGRQTSKRSELIDLRWLRSGPPLVSSAVADVVHRGAEVVVFDTVDGQDLSQVGEHIWEHREQARFVVGSSGVSDAVGPSIGGAGKKMPPAPPVPQIVVAVGSASPVSAAQRRWAVAHGFAEVILDPRDLTTAKTRDLAIEKGAKRLIDSWALGKSAVVHFGDGDAHAPHQVTPSARHQLGDSLGHVLAALLMTSEVTRLCVAGGDTCGRVARVLGVEAFQMKAELTPGAPLCSVISQHRWLDGLEVVFKGGQTGSESFFEAVRTGRRERRRGNGQPFTAPPVNPLTKYL